MKTTFQRTILPTQREWRRQLRAKRLRKSARKALSALGLSVAAVGLAFALYLGISHRYPGLLPDVLAVTSLFPETSEPARPSVLRGGNALNSGGTLNSNMAVNGSHSEGLVTHVRDGDTIEVSGRPIRLASLDCAEKGTPEGDAATRQMRALVSNAKLHCSLNGKRSYDRWVGSCRMADGRDIADVMIAQGACRRWR